MFGNGEQVAQVTERLREGASAADSLGGLEYEPDPPIRTSRITALLSRDGGRTAVLGAARPSSGSRLSTNIMTLAVQDLELGEAVLMTTYHSDGQTVVMDFAHHIVFDYAPGNAHPESAGTVTIVHGGQSPLP